MSLSKFFAVSLVLVLFLSAFTACSPIDNDYGVSSEASVAGDEKISDVVSEEKFIMSSDRVMSKYFDISLFDEENYADIYLGENFNIKASFAGKEFNLPCYISDFEEKGWKLSAGNSYDKNSLVFAYETIDAVFVNKSDVKIAVQFYNSSKSSIRLSECYIVKVRIENDFYSNPKKYSKFNINGIKNGMAITDIVNTLGTPSHFYKVSSKSYYLDYFITKADRRNGITVYINPLDDSITSIEFSYYNDYRMSKR